MSIRIRTLRSGYQLLLAFITVSALAVQYLYGLRLTDNPLSYTEQFLSYFTIASNIFVATVFSYESVRSLQGKALTQRFDFYRGAAVFCIIATGVTYALFLRGPGRIGQVEHSIAWINATFHYVIPSLVALDWLLFPPRRSLPWLWILGWFGISVLYVFAVLGGGFLTHLYPYFFLDPDRIGYLGVSRASAGFLPFFLVFGFFVVATANIQQRFRKTR
jgi:hypothetical protein